MGDRPATDGYGALRTSVAAGRGELLRLVRVTGPAAFDAANRLIAGELGARSGRLVHSLMLREDATPLADVLAGSDDDGLLLLCEGPPEPELVDHVRAALPARTEARGLSETHALVTLDGPWAWELLGEVAGPEIVGLPPLSFCPLEDGLVLRCGKTGEYGYVLAVPREREGALRERLAEAGRRWDLGEATPATLEQAMLENWFFNVRREGRAGATPLELQLQWRVSYKKDYVGADAMRRRRAQGIAERLVCLVAPGEAAVGDVVECCEGLPVGRIVNAGRSPLRRGTVALALLQRPRAHPHVPLVLVHDGAPGPARTVCPPVLLNRSLFVNPQRHSYFTRDEIAFPPAA